MATGVKFLMQLEQPGELGDGCGVVFHAEVNEPVRLPMRTARFAHDKQRG